MTKPKATSLLKSKAVWLYVIVGIAFVGAAILVGQQTGLAERLTLDSGGIKVEGTIHRRDDNKLTIRFDGPGDTIYRSSFTVMPGILDATYEDGPATLIHHPQDPRRSQPAGASYRVGALALTLFCIGFACVLHARRLATHPTPTP